MLLVSVVNMFAACGEILACLCNFVRGCNADFAICVWFVRLTDENGLK